MIDHKIAEVIAAEYVNNNSGSATQFKLAAAYLDLRRLVKGYFKSKQVCQDAEAAAEHALRAAVEN